MDDEGGCWQCGSTCRFEKGRYLDEQVPLQDRRRRVCLRPRRQLAVGHDRRPVRRDIIRGVSSERRTWNSGQSTIWAFSFRRWYGDSEHKRIDLLLIGLCRVRGQSLNSYQRVALDS